METLCSVNIDTAFGQKELAVCFGDAMDYRGIIDILTTSAFVNSYEPTPRTMFRALYDNGISVKQLAKDPEIDLRKFCRTWLSREIVRNRSGIQRIGCVELLNYRDSWRKRSQNEETLIASFCAYFSMLDVASAFHVKMGTVALPLLGSGDQSIDVNLLIVPLINECISFLKRNRNVERIIFIEKNLEKADFISQYIQKSYSVLTQQKEYPKQNLAENRATAFISYASADKNVADNLCAKLESKGIRVWYAPRDVRGPYADAIVRAIDGCSHFIVILSENSMKSQHVLNEIDLAFQGLPNYIKFKPLRIDTSDFEASFRYYLSRQHWMDAAIPPLEERLNEFVKEILKDL